MRHVVHVVYRPAAWWKRRSIRICRLTVGDERESSRVEMIDFGIERPDAKSS